MQMAPNTTARYINGGWFLVAGFSFLLAGLLLSAVIDPIITLLVAVGFLCLIYWNKQSVEAADAPGESESHREQDHPLVFENGAIGLAHITREGRFLTANPCLQKLTGYAETELKEKTFKSILVPTHGEGFCRFTDQFEGPEGFSFDIQRVQHKSGHTVWVKVTYSPIHQDPTHDECLILSLQDISDLKQTEALLRQSRQRLKCIVESLSDEVGIWMSTPGFGEILYVNESYERLWGISRHSLFLQPHSFLRLVHSEDEEKVLAHLTEHEKGHWNIDFRIVQENGRVRYVHDVGTGVYEDGKLMYLVGTTIDRTMVMEHQTLLDNSLRRLKEAYAQLQDAAQRDGLTGILNRSAIMTLIDRACENFQRYGTPATLVFIDLDRFKQVNDSHGHVVGDRTLVALVNHLKQNIRQTDDISRYGGDEFVVLLNNSTYCQAEEFCRRAGQSVMLTLCDGTVINASMSFGISELSDQIRDTEHWISEADSRMYRVKGQVQ